jgi:hypothetical protein
MHGAAGRCKPSVVYSWRIRRIGIRSFDGPCEVEVGGSSPSTPTTKGRPVPVEDSYVARSSDTTFGTAFVGVLSANALAMESAAVSS